MFRRKLSGEEMARCVMKYISGKGSIEGIAAQVGVDGETFRKWVKRYQAEGLEAFQPVAKNRAYSPELKREAVEAYMSGQGSLMELAIKYHLRSKTQLGDWIKVYNAHGDFNSRKHSGGGSYMKQGRETTQAERLEIVKECLSGGKNYGAMAQKHKVSYQQVRNWTLRFEELGEAGLEDRRGKRKKDQTPRTELERARIEIEQLKHKLYLAEGEIGLLKKLDEIVRRDALDK